MTRIGLLSDTHANLDERIFSFFENCDEIWHAGDIGSAEVLEKLRNFKPLRIVYGNIDSHKIRHQTERELIFQIEGVKVYMTHIGGYPGKYDTTTYMALKKHKPKLFVCGHSHILKVMYDQRNSWLHINPGAAGNFGFHQKRTLIRFVVDGENMKDMEVIELGDRTKQV